MRQIKNATAALALAAVLASCGEDPGTNEDGQTSVPPTEAADCQTLSGDHQALARGCWAIQLDGLSGGPQAELELPAGFSASDWGVWLNSAKEGEWGTIALRAVGDVYPDPCARAGTPPTVGPSVQDFATALAAQKVTTTTTPVPVALGGHDGLYLELSVPADFDTKGCRDHELILWEGDGESTGADTSFVSRYWVLDVNGRTVAVVVNTHPKATEETIDLFTGIVESATFAEG